MKTFWMVVVLGAVLAGCASRKESESQSADLTAATTNFIVSPSIDLIGHVQSINTRDRFVVIAYPTNVLPEREQKLNVYREGRKVGELRVTGFRQENLTAADILAGEIYVGDDVRIN